jgi:hypothetical protein
MPMAPVATAASELVQIGK